MAREGKRLFTADEMVSAITACIKGERVRARRIGARQFLAEIAPQVREMEGAHDRIRAAVAQAEREASVASTPQPADQQEGEHRG